MKKKSIKINQCLFVALSLCCVIMTSCEKTDVVFGNNHERSNIQSKDQDSFLATIEAKYCTNNIYFFDYYGLINSDDNLCEWRRFENDIFIHDYVISFSGDDSLDYDCLFVSQDSIVLMSNDGDTMRIKTISVNNDGSTTCSMYTQCGMQVHFAIRLPEGIDMLSLFSPEEGNLRAVPIGERLKKFIEKIWHTYQILVNGDICRTAANAAYNACLAHSECWPVYIDNHLSLRCNQRQGSPIDCNGYSYTCPL